jgi:hypothetical protein
MIFRLSRIDWRNCGTPKFITLTYPDERAERALSQLTQDRSQFVRDMERYVGNPVATIWRREWQARKTGDRIGEPVSHVHILAFTNRFIPWKWVRERWKSIIDFHGYVRTECKAANNGYHAAKYVAKYASKPDEPSLVIATYLNKVGGRCWGITRPDLVPLCRLEAYDDVPPAAVDALFRLARPMWVGLEKREPGAFTLLGEPAETAFRKFEKQLLMNEWAA